MVAGTTAIEMYALPIGLDAGEQYASARTFLVLCQILLRDEVFSMSSEIELSICLNAQRHLNVYSKK
jgi:hypothetical protein